MNKHNPAQIVRVALGVCLVCSLLVSAAVVTLRSRQDENRRLDRIKNILVAADLPTEDGGMIGRIYQQTIVPTLVNLETGKEVDENAVDEILMPENFDIVTVANHPEHGRRLPPPLDMAQIGRVPRNMVVYQVREQGEIKKLILPIYGKGLWSTLYGFLALDADLRTVTGISFYQHAETPGLGGEIENPRWQAIWKGKQAFDEGGTPQIRVIKGRVDPDADGKENQIDGLSGATITTRGVDQMVRFWLGVNGYGPFLNNLREAD